MLGNTPLFTVSNATWVSFVYPAFHLYLGFFFSFSWVGQLQIGHLLHSGLLLHAWHCPIVLWPWPSVLLFSLQAPVWLLGLGVFNLDLRWSCGVSHCLGRPSCDSDSLSRILGTTCTCFSVLTDADICGPPFSTGCSCLTLSSSVSLGCQPVERLLVCLQRAFKDASGTGIFIRDRSGKPAL